MGDLLDYVKITSGVGYIYYWFFPLRHGNLGISNIFLAFVWGAWRSPPSLFLDINLLSLSGDSI